MSTAITEHDVHGHPPDDHHHDDHHYNPGFIQKYIFSTDHKWIGIQYGVTGLVFLFFGFLLMLAMRWQLASPNTPIPYFGGMLQWIFGNAVFLDPASAAAAGKVGIMPADGYNTFGEIGRAPCR